jgi:hypothetical protein
MALPCSFHLGIEPGKRHYVYLQLFVADELERRRARLCDACFQELLSDFLACSEVAMANGSWRLPKVPS